jgi:pimeloyl-ACP methyl ester carboxylesterase
MPITLVRGGLSGFVQDDDVAEMLRRKPHVQVHVVEGAGHSVQSDRPLILVEILKMWLHHDQRTHDHGLSRLKGPRP